MTFQWYDILAAGDDGFINILVVVAMLVFGLIGHLIKKAQEKKQVEEADRKVEEAKRRHAAEASSEHAQTEPPPGPLVPAAGAQQPAPVIHADADLGQGVSRGVVQVRKQLAAKEMQQRQRLAPTKSLRPTISETTMPARPAGQDGPQIHLNLAGPKAARTAIICAEILGPPKSLRTDPEPWDA